MFKATRDVMLGAGRRVAAVWRDMRGRGMVGLFVFELVVVTLGVLLAQGIANHTAERATRDRIEATLARLDEGAALNMSIAEGWLLTARCMRGRVEGIMRLAGEGRALPEGWTDRPPIAGTYDASLSDEESVLVRRLVGENRAFGHEAFELHRLSLDRGAESVTNQWNRLAILDPALGPVSDLDRSNARLAAADLLASFRRIEISAAQLLASGQAMGLETDYRGSRVATSCEEFWQAGAHLPVDSGGAS
ncbi:hypothetical protein [Sphingomicrobium arenosum]|uniref:hypothetical protein n=1 Tax=Sphingomicrobium arenosum TaxID=2233861 RepID=UPI002240FF5F|nr:hypothetical protein [Sphingomicrobium arenosum]